MINTIIFDLDGVIIDSEPLKKQAELAAAKKHGLVIPDSAVKNYLNAEPKADGSHYREFVKRYSKIPHNTLYTTRVDIYHKLIETELKPLPGALDFLDHVNGKFAKTGLATSSYIYNVAPIFDRFNLYRYFDVIISGTDIDNFKPHPEPYLRVLAELGSQPTETIVIEDAPSGIQSAKTAGCQVIAITSSFPAEHLARSKPHHIVPHFSTAKKVIDGLQRD